MILAQNGDVADDVQRRDICCKDNDANGIGDGCVGCWRGTFAEGFDDFFDASFEGFVDGGCNTLAMSSTSRTHGRGKTHPSSQS